VHRSQCVINDSARRKAARVSTVRDLYLRYRQLIHEGYKFCIVGGVGVIITDGGTNLLQAHHRMDWLVADVIATIVAIGVTFIGSRYWTFAHRERSGMGRETGLFWGIAVLGLLIQLACLGFVTKVLGDTKGLLPNIGLLVGIVVATVFRFWAYRKWVWREPLAEVLEEEHEAIETQDAPVPSGAASSSASGAAGGLRDDERGRVS
jgi:putative flippase GtrA